MKSYALLLILLLFAGAFFYLNPQYLPFAIGEGQPVFCDDYEWVCCGIKEGSTHKLDYSKYVNANEPFKCPYYKCVFPKSVRVCISKPYKTFTTWSCTYKVTKEVKKGEYVISNDSYPYWTPVYYKDYHQRLAWCGDAACDAGKTGISIVDGSCSYPFEGDVYDSSYKKIQPLSEFIPSNSIFPQNAYTVPVGECYLAKKSRHICGYTNEMCSSDEDCKKGHKYIYNGLGAECHTGMLQLYRCQKEVCLKQDPKGNCIEGRQSFCTVAQTITVECCPGAGSCGFGQVCDPNTFRCKPAQQVECTDDFDCDGWQTRCDRDKKEIGGNKCINGKCQWVAQKKVECCFDDDCPEGYYCNADYKCVKAPEEKLPCPWECCENEPNYYDKPAPEGYVCCPDHTIAKSLQECQSQAGQTADQIFKALMMLAVIIFGIIFLILILWLIFRKVLGL